MYKGRLQEYCQRNSWSLPRYTTTTDGPGHNLKFKGTVHVNGVDYETQGFHTSSKGAQNEAARVAFESLIDAGQSSSDEGDPFHSGPSKQNDDKGDTAAPLSGHVAFASVDLAKLQIKDPCPEGLPQHDLPKNSYAETGTQGDASNLVERNEAMASEVQLNYKSYLQELVQEKRWSSPVYSHVREGPPHAPRFKATVIVEGKSFKGPDFCGTVREAEHDAAKIALASFQEEGIQEEKSLSFKNMLKDYSQKRNLHLPTYTTERSGACHSPTFRSTVEIDGEVYTGDAATTKKEAEANAAKIAWFTLKEHGSRTSSSSKLQLGTISDASAVNLATNERNYKPEASSSDNTEAKGSLVLNNRKERAISNVLDKDESHLGPEEESIISSQFAADICNYLNEQFIAGNSTAQGTEPASSASERQLLAPTSSSSKYASDQSRPKGSTALDAGTSTASKVQNKVVVFPRLRNMKLPQGVQVQFSDRKWVAVTGTDSCHGAK